MKALIYCVAILLLVVGLSAWVRVTDALRIKVDRRRFLQALNGARYGGIGRYWLTREVWGMHTQKDFAYADNRMLAHGIAERHFDWLLSAMLAANLKCDAETMALAWIAGIGAVRRGSFGPADDLDSKRVAVIYASLEEGDEQ